MGKQQLLHDMKVSQSQTHVYNKKNLDRFREEVVQAVSLYYPHQYFKIECDLAEDNCVYLNVSAR